MKINLTKTILGGLIIIGLIIMVIWIRRPNCSCNDEQRFLVRGRIYESHQDPISSTYRYYVLQIENANYNDTTVVNMLKGTRIILNLRTYFKDGDYITTAISIPKPIKEEQDERENDL